LSRTKTAFARAGAERGAAAGETRTPRSWNRRLSSRSPEGSESSSVDILDGSRSVTVPRSRRRPPQQVRDRAPGRIEGVCRSAGLARSGAFRQEMTAACRRPRQCNLAAVDAAPFLADPRAAPGSGSGSGNAGNIRRGIFQAAAIEAPPDPDSGSCRAWSLVMDEGHLPKKRTGNLAVLSTGGIVARIGAQRSGA